jgi:hypothetical protein
MTDRRLTIAAVAAFTCGLTFLVTWPQVIHPSEVADHFDPYFSIWRLGHIAHALTRWPIDLFDTNIFYPAKGTFAYSDAVLLEGIIAAPLLWLHLSPSLVYNIVLLAGFVGSGIGMFVLARHLTGATAPSLVAVTIFTGFPYRIEHVMHLELQWAMFIPLSLWAVHRTIESGRWRYGLLAGIFVWLQFMSCIYYGVFLSLTLVLFVPLLVVLKAEAPVTKVAPPLLTGALLAIVLILPYVRPYAAVSRDVGARPLEEISRYSATIVSYFATSSVNRLYGWTADVWGAPELRLFPGFAAALLALAAVGHPRRRLVIVYAVTTLMVIQLSFGLNGWVYSALLSHVSALQGFRALARFGIVFGCTLAILAALGVQAMLTRWHFTPRWRRALVPIAIAVIVVEYLDVPLPLSYAIPAAPAELYKALLTAEPGPIVELPLPLRNALPGYDPYYQAWSVWHWRPMLNGYSGFYAPAYLNALDGLRAFPDPGSIRFLRDLGVRYVIVHRAFFERDTYTPFALKVAANDELRVWGVYRERFGLADILEIRR